MAPAQSVMLDLLSALPDPTTAAIKAARGDLSQTEAAALVGATRDAWAKWEGGARSMPGSTWALYLLATGQHPAHVISTR